MVSYDKNTQRKASEELRQLPPGSVLPRIVTDYSKYRDACRKINRRR